MAHPNMIGILDDIISNGFEDDASGSTDSIVGYAALVNISREAVEGLMHDLYDNDWTAGYVTAPEPGWYLFRQDNDGFKRYEGPLTQTDAYEKFNAHVAEYDKYLGGAEDWTDGEWDQDQRERAGLDD